MLGMALMSVLSFMSPEPTSPSEPILPSSGQFYKTGSIEGRWSIYESNDYIIVGNSSCVSISHK